MRRAAALLVLLPVVARAEGDVAVLEPEPAPASTPPIANGMPVPEQLAATPAPVTGDGLRPQVQIDGGLSVIGPAFEYPIAKHVAIEVEAFVFGTYFLPWFDAGDDVKGFGAGVRPTWFARESGHGLYVAPYFRVVGVDAESITGADGIGFTTGVFAGWAFAVGKRLDVRLGLGAQYLRFHAHVDGVRETTSTPFVAIDAVLGYRL